MSEIHSQVSRLEEEDFGWLTGRSVEAVEFHEPALWVLRLSAGGLVSTEDTWRLSSPSGLVACSRDHGQWFGLASPVNAAEVSMSALAGRRIAHAGIRPNSPDLEIRLDEGLVLELLALSQGFECWQVENPAGRCVTVRGNRDMQAWRADPSP